MTRTIAILLGIGIGMALSPLVVAVPQSARLAGMAVVLGAVLALGIRDLIDRRKW